jgi:hypothetical protein
VGGITGALLSLALNLPAQWLANGVHAATHWASPINKKAQGSVWKGSGKLGVDWVAQAGRDALALPGSCALAHAFFFESKRFAQFEPGRHSRLLHATSCQTSCHTCALLVRLATAKRKTANPIGQPNGLAV